MFECEVSGFGACWSFFFLTFGVVLWFLVSRLVVVLPCPTNYGATMGLVALYVRTIQLCRWFRSGT